MLFRSAVAASLLLILGSVQAAIYSYTVQPGLSYYAYSPYYGYSIVDSPVVYRNVFHAYDAPLRYRFSFPGYYGDRHYTFPQYRNEVVLELPADKKKTA